MNDRTSRANETGRRTAASVVERPGVQPPSPDHTQGRAAGAKGGLFEGPATNVSAFASWSQAARLRDVPASGETLPIAGAYALQQAAGHMGDNAFVELVVSSFKSFREVGGFQRALASVPEAGSIRVRHLHQGTLQISVQCRSAGALLRSLASAYEQSFTVLVREPHRIELALLDGASRAASVV